MPDQVAVLQRLEEQVQKALLANEDDITAALWNTYQTRLNVLIKDLMWANSDFLAGEDKAISRWRALQLDRQSIEMIATHLDGLNKQIATDLVDDLTQFGKNSYQMTSWAVDQGIPVTTEMRWNLPTDDVIKAFIGAPWQGQMFSDRVGEITNTMARQLQQSLTDGIMAGDSIQDIARDMRKNVGIPEDGRLITRPRASAQVYRGLLIARTEAMRLNNQMRERIFNDNKSLMADEVWAAAPAFIRVCDDCAERDGMTRAEIEEEYGVGFEISRPPLHPNCRCMYMMRPKPFQDLLPDSLKAAGKGLYGDIADTEMKYVDPSNPGTLLSMKVVPYDEWMAN
jgi:hypothetical protein